jgi:AAA15 family ATPase/GTPase
MLIEFTVENFRSFWATQTFSMVAGASSEHLQSNTFKSRLNGFGHFLRTSAIYGPNAAGKTNLLRALQFMQSLVINSAATATGAAYTHTPFIFARIQRRKPSKFLVTFAQNGTWYEYGFAMGPERIEEEWLIEHVHARGRTIFERKYSATKREYEWKFSPSLKGQKAVWSEATRPTALFLSTAVQLNSKQLLPVYEWFQKRLVVVTGVTTLNPSLTLMLMDQPDGKARLLPFLQEADLGISDVKVTREPLPPGAGFISTPQQIFEQIPGTNAVNLIRVTLSHQVENKKEEQVGLDLSEESSGTQVLFRSAGAWLNVFTNGEVLLFDEIDTSLHPLLVRFLVQRFHSEATNPRNSQLIFTTHNTSLLDQRVFRRDQIWFVEKDRAAASRLYPLTDFKPRKDEDLEGGYMRGRYGALPLLGDM